MPNLLAGDALDLRPDGHSFEIDSPAGVLGRAHWHRGDAGMSPRRVARALSRQWSAGARYVVEDVNGTPQLEVLKSEGRTGAFAMQVRDALGRPLGSAAADSVRLLRTSPHVALSDPSGAPLGHMTTSGAPEVFDAQGRPVADISVGATRVVMGQPLYRVRFATQVDHTTKAIVLGAVMCWAVRFR